MGILLFLIIAHDLIFWRGALRGSGKIILKLQADKLWLVECVYCLYSIPIANLVMIHHNIFLVKVDHGGMVHDEGAFHDRGPVDFSHSPPVPVHHWWFPIEK